MSEKLPMNKIRHIPSPLNHLTSLFQNFRINFQYWKKSIFEVLWALLKNPFGLTGCLIITALIAIAVFSPWLAPYDPSELISENNFLGPNRTYLLGTDHLGRDVLSRIIYGTRTALIVGCVTPLIAMISGLILGVTAAYIGGIVDNLIILLFDILRSFPAILLILVLVSVTGPSIYTIIFCMALVIMTLHGRAARSRALSVKEDEFVEAAKGLGASKFRIIFFHIIPHVVSPLIVMFGMDVPIMITMEAGLSFLGLGVQPPMASWGKMIRIGYNHIFDYPLLFVWPAIMLIITAVGFALLSESLRKILEPGARIEELTL